MLRNFLISCGFLLTMWTQVGLADVQIQNAKAVLQRSGKNVTLTFTLVNLGILERKNLEITDTTEANGTLMLTKFLDICVFTTGESSSNCISGNLPPKVRYSVNTEADQTPETDRSKTISATFPAGATSFVVNTDTDTTGNTFRMEVSIEIASSDKKLDSSTKLTLRLPTAKGATTFTDAASDVSIAVGVKSVIQDLTVKPSIGKLTVTWDKETTVPLNDGKNTPSKPTGALAVIVPEDLWDNAQIPLRTYKPNPDEEGAPDVHCNIKASVDLTTCTLNCTDSETDHYINKANLQDDSNNLIFVESGNTGALAFADLDKGTKYAIVYQSQPDGLERKCLIGSPSDAVTLSQLGGAGDPVLKDPRCFIATAAYGSALDPHLDTLRWFRDNVLLVTKVGHKLVQTYYHYSPPLADFIGAHPTLRAMTRGALWLPVILIETWRERPSLLLTLTGMVGTFVLLYLRRRSLRASI